MCSHWLLADHIEIVQPTRLDWPKFDGVLSLNHLLLLQQAQRQILSDIASHQRALLAYGFDDVLFGSMIPNPHLGKIYPSM